MSNQDSIDSSSSIDNSNENSVESKFQGFLESAGFTNADSSVISDLRTAYFYGAQLVLETSPDEVESMQEEVDEFFNEEIDDSSDL